MVGPEARQLAYTIGRQVGGYGERCSKGLERWAAGDGANDKCLCRMVSAHSTTVAPMGGVEAPIAGIGGQFRVAKGLWSRPLSKLSMIMACTARCGDLPSGLG